MSEQRFQPVKGTSANIEKTAKAAGQLLIATDTGQMYLDVSNQERISIGGSGVQILYAQDTAPQKLSDLQYTLMKSSVINGSKAKKDDLVINISDGAFYQILSVGPMTLFCQRLAITGSGGGGGGEVVVQKIGFANNILNQLKNLYVYGEDYSLTITPYAENDTTVTVTVSLYDEADTAIDRKAYYEYKKQVTNYSELVIDLGSQFEVGNTEIDIKLESLNSGSTLVRYGGQQIVQLRLDEDGFHPEKICTSTQPISFNCKPVGQVEKELHILIDGFEVKTQTVSASTSDNTVGVEILGSQLNTHGIHVLDAYLTAEINGNTIESNHLNYEIAYAAPGNNSPIIWFMNKPSTIEQYEDIIVKYMVYDPTIGSNGTMSIEQLHDSLVVTTLDEVQYSASSPFTWVIADATVGDNYYGVSCKGVTESFVITVTKSNRNMDYVQPDLMVFNLNANGRTNNESALSRQKWQYSWHDSTYDCILNNFNWHTNGWSTDSDGKSYLKISDGASVQIPLNEPGQVGIVLNKDGTQNYTFEFRLKIRNITSYDTLIKNTTKYKLSGKDEYLTQDELIAYAKAQEEATGTQIDPDELVEMDEFQSQIVKVEKTVSTDKGVCVSYLSGSKGFALGTQETYFGTGQEYVNAKYKEDEVFNISYVVSSNEDEALSKVYIYVNGLLTGISTISSGSSVRGFSIPNSYITINSDYCDVDLYAVRVYRSALDSWSIVQNYLADLRNVEDYDQNQISNNNKSLTVIDYDKLLQYNQTQTQNGKPDLLSMPYLIIQTVDNIGTGAEYATDDGTAVNKKNKANVVPMPISDENLPYLKGKKRYVKVSFTNPALDYAYNNGDLESVAKSAGVSTAAYYAYHCPSFVAYGGELDVQGTSSQAYPRRNYKLKLKNADYWRYAGGPNAAKDITGSDGLVWCMDVNSSAVHNNKWTLKIDYMESSGSYNTGFANMVHYMYDKHPLDYYREAGLKDIEDDVLKTYRTSVKGYPVLTFHAVKNKQGKLEYQYIGRYNMNIDKGSDESYGFKYDAEQSILGKDYKKIVECWEMADNQGNYCSFKFPYKDAGQTGFTVEEGGKLNSKDVLEIIDHLEYRYNNDADNLDVCYAGVENVISRAELESPLYEDDIAPYEKAIKTAENEIKTIRTNDSALDAELTALEKELKAAEDAKDKDKQKEVQAQIDAKEDSNDLIKAQKAIISEQEALIEAKGAEFATKDDYNSLIAKRYKNIEKLYKWFDTVDIAANPYSTEEKLLYGDSLDTLRTTISNAQAEIEVLDFELKTIETQLTILAKQKTEATTDDEKTKIQGQIDDANTRKDAIPAEKKVWEDEITKAEESIAAATPTAEQATIDAYTLAGPVTINNVVYTYDTQAYRKAKFKAEFDKHLNKEYCLVYYIMTELLLCYDSRGKNMMIASWGPMEKDGDYIWFPIFYDIDTQLGINNTGIPTWDYDVDASMNAKAGAETFSTANSVLWYNLLQCFEEEIKQKYQEMRKANLNREFIENAYRCSPDVFTTSYACRGVRPLVALNSDFEYKYILPTLPVGEGIDYGYINTAGNWVQDTGNSFFYACQGDRDLSRQLLIRNRMNYLDSEMQADIYSPTGSTSTTSLKLRASANSTSTSDNILDVADLTDAQRASKFVKGALGSSPELCLPLDGTPYYKITPFLSQYVTMYYDDNNPTAPQKFTNDMSYVLPVVPDSIMQGYKSSVPFTQQLVYIPGANYLSKVEGLDMKYIDEIQLESSIRLTELVLGNDTKGYFNNNSVSLSLADSADTTKSPNKNAKTLLKKVVLTGLKNIKSTSANIDISGSSKLEEFRALNTNITGCKVATGAPISIMHLPSTVQSILLNTNYNLTKIIDTPIVEDDFATKSTLEGLYIDGLTGSIADNRTKSLSEIAANSLSKLALESIEIKNDSLGYDSYQLVKNAMARKIATSDPTDVQKLALRLENVVWTPYKLLDTAAEIDSETTYYELNDHYEYVKINPTTDEKFTNKRNNSLIYIKVGEADAENQITNMELIDKFITVKEEAGEKVPQFHDTTYSTNVPYLSGEIYVDNSADTGITISEIDIQNYNKTYPSLDIRAAKVDRNYTIKYIQIDDVTGLTKVYETQKAKNCVCKAEAGDDEYFSNPNRNVTLVPSKNNYDFYGWSTDNTRNGVVIEPKSADSEDYLDSVWETNTEKLAAIAAENDNVVTLYAVFELHKYKATFYAEDGETVLGYTETPYSRTDGVNVLKILPSKSADDLDLTSVWGFTGWAFKSKPGQVLDMSTVHPIMDYEFRATFTEKSVYDNVIDNSYLSFSVNGDGYYVGAASGVTLSGKITLPATYNGKDVIGIRNSGFRGQLDITHIFFSNGSQNKVSYIGENAFNDVETLIDVNSKLVYFEMSTVVDSITIQNNAFRFTQVIQNLSSDDQKLFFKNVTYIGQNAFATPYVDGNYNLQSLRLPGCLITLDSGAFANHKNLSDVQIGSADDPSKLVSVGGSGPFSGCGKNALSIVYCCAPGSDYTSTIKTNLMVGTGESTTVQSLDEKLKGV